MIASIHQKRIYRNVKSWIFTTLEIKNQTIPGRLVAGFLVLLISVNVLAVILDSVDEIRSSAGTVFSVLEMISVVIFSLEYCLRLFACTSDERYSHPVLGRIRYVFSFLSIVDILSILPFYLPLVMAIDLRVLRALRLTRILRIFKFVRYAQAFDTFRSVLRHKKEQLLTTFILICLLVVMSSALLFFAEHDAQPKVFSSIPATMWWSVVSLTTVGYGDMYPITAFGKMVAAIILVLSIGVFAIPAGIIASGFTEYYGARKTRVRCRHCHQEFEHPE